MQWNLRWRAECKSKPKPKCSDAWSQAAWNYEGVYENISRYWLLNYAEVRPLKREAAAAALCAFLWGVSMFGYRFLFHQVPPMSRVAAKNEWPNLRGEPKSAGGSQRVYNIILWAFLRISQPWWLLSVFNKKRQSFFPGSDPRLPCEDPGSAAHVLVPEKHPCTKPNQKVDSGELHSLLHVLITLLQGCEPWTLRSLRQGVLQGCSCRVKFHLATFLTVASSQIYSRHCGGADSVFS